MNLRPDELASQSAIQKSKQEDELLKKGIGFSTGLGTAGLGVGLAKKALPFLSEFIPVDLAMKGINKVAPEIGKFLKKGQSMGLDLKKGFNFLRENLSPKSNQSNPLQDFETNYPEIVQALSGHINNGRSPQEAAAILKTSTPFGQKIKKIEKDTGKNFVDFILEMMGGNQSSQMQQPQQIQQQAPQGTPVTQQTQQSQGRGIDPHIAQLMQGIRSSIQGLRGQNNQPQNQQGLPVYYDYDRG